jgi:hypothetical protein
MVYLSTVEIMGRGVGEISKTPLEAPDRGVKGRRVTAEVRMVGGQSDVERGPQTRQGKQSKSTGSLGCH